MGPSRKGENTGNKKQIISDCVAVAWLTHAPEPSAMGTAWYSECQGICARFASVFEAQKKKTIAVNKFEKIKKGNFCRNWQGQRQWDGLGCGPQCFKPCIYRDHILWFFDCSALVSQGAPLAANSKWSQISGRWWNLKYSKVSKLWTFGMYSLWVIAWIAWIAWNRWFHMVSVCGTVAIWKASSISLGPEQRPVTCVVMPEAHSKSFLRRWGYISKFGYSPGMGNYSLRLRTGKPGKLGDPL